MTLITKKYMNEYKALWAAPILSLPRRVKQLVVLSLDAFLCIFSVWVAFYLRLGEWVDLTRPVLYAMAMAMLVAIPVFVSFGLYRAIFRFNGGMAVGAVLRACLLYGVVFAAVFTWLSVPGVPRTVGLIQPVLLLILVGMSRALAGLWLGGVYQGRLVRAALPQLLIYGAGSAGRQLAAAMTNSHEMRVVGFLDDDDRLHGHVLNGLPVYNPLDLKAVLAKVHISDVLLALPSASRQRRNSILADLASLHLAVRTLPSVSDIASGRVSLSDVRELDIDDLLGREPVKPHGLLLNRNVHGKSVLVTGAGGSIGSELCRQILKCQPRQLLLVEMSEFALYQIHQELLTLLADGMAGTTGIKVAAENELDQAMQVAGIEVVPLLGSVCDAPRMQDIMETWQPHTVYHAAAYKHVPLVEHNPAEGVRNNVWGTQVCAQAAQRNGVRNFVLVSTDKAVRPTNIMGASKRLAEMVLQALAEHHSPSHSTRVDGIGSTKSVHATEGVAKQSATAFSMVRFGNVLGSSGSVVPLFREQIKNGGPITLTHTDITRYFMTIPEAAQLVIQAGAMGQGGDVFVLDMGQPVKIIDLARRMVELSGMTVRDELNPSGDIELVVTGLRPGEKLYEELLIGDNPKPTQHARIMKAHEQFLSWPKLEQKLNALSIAMSVNDVPVIRGQLQELVTGYQPSGEVVDWVHMALEREALANE
jgi:FlaA1/EpsC-like NDP-sugar epimerase